MGGAEPAKIACVADQQPEMLQQPALQFRRAAVGGLAKKEMRVTGNNFYRSLFLQFPDKILFIRQEPSRGMGRPRQWSRIKFPAAMARAFTDQGNL